MTRDAWRERCARELGKPYIWGANGPQAYDCSGFVQWALSLLQLDPPGDQTAAGLYRFFSAGRSTEVTPAESRTGDIVFFGTAESVTHVALAWDGGEMLEAGGGGRKTTSEAIARQQGAMVRVRPIASRHDLVAILRPRNLAWPVQSALESALESVGSAHYENSPPLLEWLPDGRHMRLKRPFGFVQESGLEWPVPEDAVVDGASIPRVFWSLIGGPFEGPYRDASIVHDHYCDIRTRPWEDTHRVFYDGMLCSGVPPVKAKIMYYAVYRFGPRWSLGPSATASAFEAAGEVASVAAPVEVESFDAASFEEDAELIRAADLSPEAIESLADKRAQAASLAAVARAASASGLAAAADAALARRPMLQRLVELQDDAATPTEAQAAGALLRRFTSAERVPTPPGELEAAPPFEALEPEYTQLFATCRIRPEREGEVAWHRKKLLQYRPRYEAVAAATGVPWWFIGIVHALEASFDFTAHLHNGDPLTARTTHVPKGLPKVWNPPNDWESSAIDAIAHQGLEGAGDWRVATALYRWEAYNGYGYHPRGIPSPYLWSFSTHYTKGKFVKDGVFDPEAVSKQCGAAVMLLALQQAGAVDLG